MDKTFPLRLLDRFVRIFQGVGRAVGDRGRTDSILGPALPHPLLSLVCVRLISLQTRLTRLLRQIDAGTLRPLPEPDARRRSADTPPPDPGRAGQMPQAETRAGQPPRQPEAAAQPQAETQPGLRPEPRPRPKPEAKPKLSDFGIKEGWGWLTGIGKHPLAHWLGELQILLEDPEVQALIAEHPRHFGPILRQFCKMLGVVEIPDVLRLPSQKDVVTVDWTAVAAVIAAQLAARAAGLPLPENPPRTTWGARKLPFRFYFTPFGPPRPQLE